MRCLPPSPLYCCVSTLFLSVYLSFAPSFFLPFSPLSLSLFPFALHICFIARMAWRIFLHWICILLTLLCQLTVCPTVSLPLSSSLSPYPPLTLCLPIYLPVPSSVPLLCCRSFLISQNAFNKQTTKWQQQTAATTTTNEHMQWQQQQVRRTKTLHL